MSAENPAYWGYADEERLTCTEIEECIRDFCEDYEGDGPLPETLQLTGFDRMKVCIEAYNQSILEDLLERLDENYGDPDGDYTKPTDNMKQAAKEFVEKVVAEYEIWGCEAVCTKTVYLKDYLTTEELKQFSLGKENGYE